MPVANEEVDVEKSDIDVEMIDNPMDKLIDKASDEKKKVVVVPVSRSFSDFGGDREKQKVARSGRNAFHTPLVAFDGKKNVNSWPEMIYTSDGLAAVGLGGGYFKSGCDTINVCFDLYPTVKERFRFSSIDYGRSTTISLDGKVLCYQDSVKKVIKVLNMNDGKEIQEIEALRDKFDDGSLIDVSSLALSPDGKSIVAGYEVYNEGEEKSAELYMLSLKLWDIESGTEKLDLKKYNKGVNKVCITPDGKYIVVCTSLEQSIVVIDFETGNEKHKIQLGNNSCMNLVISPDSKSMVGSCDDYNIPYDFSLKVFDIESGELKLKLAGHEENVMSCFFLLMVYQSCLLTKCII